VENEIAELQAEIDEMNYRVLTWNLSEDNKSFWNDIIIRMQKRIDNLRAGM